MKHRSKMTVTLAMVWIGIMGLTATPRWIRSARDFVAKSTGHGAAPAPVARQGGSGGRLS